MEYSERYKYCLSIILGYEGGLSDDPDDAGNAGGKITFRGVTEGCLATARAKGITDKMIPTELDYEEFLAIYYQLYWKPAHCFEVPQPLDLFMLDMSVNSGAGAAVANLQEALNNYLEDSHDIDVDGGFGPQTRGALAIIMEMDQMERESGADKFVRPRIETMARNFQHERGEFFTDITIKRDKNKKFYYGWNKNRVHDLEHKAGL